jgi:probable RNA-binding protein EIF1AD
MPRPKRNVLAAAQAASEPPTSLPEHHRIARVIKAEGNSLFSVTLPSEEILLVELAAPLRNTFWIRRGGYVIVDTAALADRDNKLSGEIVTVLMQEKNWRKTDYWPTEFAKRNTYSDDDDDDEQEESNIGKLPTSDSEDEVEGADAK